MTNLDIETFWAVVQHGTMTAAAEALYITQPTLSMRIRALEERVGTPLFERSKGQRHITLTAAGQKFLTLAQRWQQLLSETETLAAVSTVALRITTSRRRSVLTPMERASSADRVSRFMRQRSRSSGKSPTAIQTAAKPTVFIRVPDRLPMSQ